MLKKSRRRVYRGQAPSYLPSAAKGGVRTTIEDVTSLMGTRYKTYTYAPKPTQKIDGDRVRQSTENINSVVFPLGSQGPDTSAGPWDPRQKNGFDKFLDRKEVADGAYWACRISKMANFVFRLVLPLIWRAPNIRGLSRDPGTPDGKTTFRARLLSNNRGIED